MSTVGNIEIENRAELNLGRRTLSQANQSGSPEELPGSKRGLSLVSGLGADAGQLPEPERLAPRVGGPIKLFVKNLPKRVPSKQVLRYFEEYGEVSYYRIPFSTQKNKNMGYAILVFQDPRVALHLIENSKSIFIDGRQVDVVRFEKVSRHHGADCSAGLPVDSARYEAVGRLSAGSGRLSGVCREVAGSSRSRRSAALITSGRIQATDTRDLSAAGARLPHSLKPTHRSYHRRVSVGTAHHSGNLRFRVGRPRSIPGPRSAPSEVLLPRSLQIGQRSLWKGSLILN